MDYQISFEQRPDYLYAAVTGTNTQEIVLAYMAEILRECEQRECYRVLIDERLEGPRLGEMDVFTVASEGSLQALGQFEAVAHVDAQMGAMSEFAETVAVNRGMPVAMFGNVDDADRWLKLRRSSDDEQSVFWHGGTRD